MDLAGTEAQLASKKIPIYETEMLTDPYKGHVTRTTYYSDGTSKVVVVPKYPPIMAKIWIY